MSISAANREWKEEAARRRDTQEQNRNLPSRWQGGRAAPYMVLVVIDGNTLETDQDGAVFAEEEITELPADYDPETDDSFIDGIFRAWLKVDGITQEKRVLAVNDGSGSWQNCLEAGARIFTNGYKFIPVAGGGKKKVYVAG